MCQRQASSPSDLSDKINGDCICEDACQDVTRRIHEPLIVRIRHRSNAGPAHRRQRFGYRKPFGRFEHPLTLAKRRFLEWRQNNKALAQAKRNAAFHYGLPTEFFHLVLGNTCGYSEGFWKEDTRTFVKEHFARRGPSTPMDRLR